ncbi:hypothetical protein SAMN04487910_3192 [Aquimarina amphilecti]|uniref:Uncharacterized protein n=1 Tax=Aquimarina amphilecti TaxID=1038014 RepID=A0A1H7SKZ2_AQUAM|nr:hypothetical protein [Aquimarina amphilecti]SEL72776.1 hypothetical protein SAMN04487910_3192 [Aquimarina amphilecti]
MKKHIVKDILNYILTENDIIKPDLINASNYKDANEVINYLKKGGKISTVSSERQCEYCGELAGSINYYTDGTWVWPEWLSHYVIKHQIKLPFDFVEQIINNNYDGELVQKIVNQELEIQFYEE